MTGLGSADLLMRVTFVCRTCERPGRVELPEGDRAFACSDCGCRYELHNAAQDDAAQGDRPLDACPVCGCSDLYVRKDFSQRLGLAIVAIGIVASSIAWGFHMIYTTYGILFGTALIDVALYFLVGNVLQCYRCRAEFRQLADLSCHEPFHLETHERYRQQAARLREADGGSSSQASQAE